MRSPERMEDQRPAVKFLLEHLIAASVLVLSTLLLAVTGYLLMFAAAPNKHGRVSSDLSALVGTFGSLAGYACIGSCLLSIILDWLQPVLRVPKWFLVLLALFLTFFVACVLTPGSDFFGAFLVGALTCVYFPAYLALLRLAGRKLSA